MAWDEIKFKISADLDFKDAVSQIQNVRSGIDGIKTSIEDMPNASKILNTSLEKTATIADSIGSKLSRLETGDFKTSDERKQLETSIRNDISELNTLRKLQTGSGEFSTAIASSWFSGLPKAVQSELDAVIPKVSNIIRTKTSALNKNGGFKGVTPQALTRQIMGDAEIQAIEKSFRESQSAWNFDTLISHLIPNVISRNKLDAYQLGRYGSLIQNERMALSKGKVVDLFPASFRQAYNNRGYTKKSFGNDMSGLVLDASSIQELNSMLASRPIMAKAALAAGISRRDSRGVLETKREITRDEWENYRAALYSELMDRISGYGKGKVDPYSTLQNDVEKIESRLTSSTSGSVMNALHDIEKFENSGSWTASTGSTKWRKLPQEGRRAMDQYVVTKYSPFLKTPTGGEVAPKEVMISESQNTRLLGRGQWKNNDDVSDTIAVVSLAGYDKNNKEHQAAVLDLYRNGRDFNGKHYIAQSSHGKGDDQIIRMIEESAYNRVSQEEAEFAAKYGIPGTYWKNFDDAEIARKMKLRQEHQEGAITAEDWGKHLEARNKAWTPTTDVGLNLNGKKIAVVDFQGMGDGATWVSNRMMADSGQVRLGVGGKGSSFVFDGKNVGEWARKSGLADAQGRIMMRGPDGNMYDVSDYDMLMPLDVIKNKGAYMNEDGTFKSGTEASKIATALGKRYGIGMLANYSKESHTSDNLGTQMASFIQMSPELRDRQVSMAMKRLEELDTEAGQLKYVFGDQNDWLSRKVNQDTQLLSTEAAQKRIDSHRQSILQDLIAGKYIDFGEGDSGIANMRLAASPLASYLLSHGGITPEVIQKARGYIEADAKQKGIAVPQYTDEEISNMLIPDANTVLDFEHKDQDWLSVIRSPTGYGNMLYARNVARQAEPIYRGMGIATNAGIYISEQQRDILQSADFDSDEAKVIYDEMLRKDIEESVKNQPFEKAALDAKPVEYTDEQLLDESQQAMLRNGRAADMGLSMGAGSSGIRIMQLDLSKPQNKKFIQQAQRLAAYYDYGTVQDKKPTDIDFSKVDAWEALGLGKEYTKFSDHADDLFSFEDDLLNSEGNPNEDYKNDVFKASNGELINLRRLRQMGVDNINLPAAFMSNHLMGVAEIGNLYQNGMVQTGRWDAISEAMDAIGYEDAGPARKKLMQTMRHMLPQFATGERTKLTDAEARALAAMSDSAENELRGAASEYYNPETGEYVASDGRTYKSLENFVEYQGRRYGIQTARNASRHFGITDSRLNAMFGEEYASQRYKNAGASEIDLLPEDLHREVYQQKEEQLDQAIQEAQEQVEQEQRASSKKRSRRRNRNKSRSTQSETETEAQTRLNELLQEREQLQQEVAANQQVIDLRNEYNSLMSDAREYNNQLWGYQKGKENKINDTKSFAEKYYGRSFYQAEEQLKPLTEFQQKLEASGAPQAVIDELTQGINNVRSDVTNNVQRDFANKAILYSKTLAEDLENKNIAPSRQKQTLDQYEESIQNAQSFVDFMQTSLEKGDVKPEQQKQYEDAIAQTTDYITRARSGKSQLQQTYTKTNEEASRQAIENLEIQYGLRNKNSYQVRSERRLRSISDHRNLIAKQHAEGNFSDAEFEEANKRLDKLQKRSSEVSLAMQDMGKTALSGITAPIKMLANQFERQIFQSAIKEVRRFVTDYNKSMTEIQMITLKSDTQIQDLGKNLINTAKEMKISVSEITNSAATLYRQGLSDEEVNDRLGVISKFSKVSGTKVDAATKLITVAMNTGLVDNAMTAADIVTALGDNAATNASEIEKGIEKAGAAAAADGTTFGQLAAMLTAITSTTQIGGNVAGRTLNTIFGRMNKIGTNELIYDENGNAVSGSAVAQLLQAQGINMYDANGNKRSSFDTLYALSQKWNGMSDAEQQQMANAIAGTRQYSNFAAIMQGMSEGDIDRYLELIGESSGITDKKFEVYAKSLEASVTNLRNTFDGLVSDLTDSGALTGFIDDISKAVQGVDNLANGINSLTGGMGGLAAIVPTVLPMLAGMALLKSGIATANLPLALAGIGAVAGGYAIASLANIAFAPGKASNEVYTERKNDYLSRYNDLDSKISRAQELNSKINRTTEENAEFESLMSDISLFNTLSGALDGATTSAESLGTAIDGMASSADGAATAIKAAEEENKRQAARDLIDNIGLQAQSVVQTFNAGVSDYQQTDRSVIGDLENRIWSRDSNGQLKLLPVSDSNQIIQSLTQTDAEKLGPIFKAIADIAPGAIPEEMRAHGNIDAADADEWTQRLWLSKFDDSVNIFTPELWQMVVDYLNHTALPSDNRATVIRSELQKSLESSLSGIVSADQLANTSKYLTDDLLARATSPNGIVNLTEELVKDVLRSWYGIDIGDYDSFSFDSIRQSVSDHTAQTAYQQYLETQPATRLQGARRARQRSNVLSFNEWLNQHPEFQPKTATTATESEEPTIRTPFETAIANATRGNKSFAEKNKLGLASDLLLSRMLSGEFGEGAEGLQKFVNELVTDADLAEAWTTAVANSQALQNIMSTQATVKDNTVQQASGDIVGQIIRALISGSLSYKTADFSTKELASLAQGGMTAVAKSRARELVAGSYGMITEAERKELQGTVISPEQINAIQQLFGAELGNKIVNGQLLSRLEQDYRDNVLDMYGRGVTEYTAQEQLRNVELAQRQAYAQRTAGAKKSEENILKTYLNGAVSNVDDYLDLAQRRRENELTSEEEARLNSYEKELTDYREKLQLEAAKTDITTMSGAYNYAQLQRQQNNKAGSAADEIFGDLSTVRNAEDFIRVMGDDATKDNFKELINAYPELAEQFKNLGLEDYLSTGNATQDSLSGLVTSSGELSAAFTSLIAVVAGVGEQMSRYAEQQTTGETYQLASNFMNGVITDADRQIAALQTVTGNSAISQQAGYEYEQWKLQKDSYDAYRNRYSEWRKDYDRATDARNIEQIRALEQNRPARVANPGVFSPLTGANISALDKTYLNTILQNMLFGQSGLSSLDRYSGLLDMINSIGTTGGITSLYQNSRFGAYDAYTSGYQYAQPYFQAQMQLEQYNKAHESSYSMLNLDNFEGDATAINEISQALKELGLDFEDARNLASRFSKELSNAGVEAFDQYTDAIQDARKAQAAQAQEIKKLQDQLYAAQRIRGKSGKKVKGRDLEEIQEYLGLSSKKEAAEYIKDYTDDMMEQLANDMQASANQKFTASTVQPLFSQIGEALDKAVANGEISEDLAVQVIPKLEAGDIQGAADIVGQIAPQLAEQLAALEGLIAQIDFSMEADLDPENGYAAIYGKMRDILGTAVATLQKPTGYSKGGGGGGGGGGDKDTHIKDMLNRQKHDRGMIEHKIKMEDIGRTTYDFDNEYEDYYNSLDRTILAYEEMEQLQKQQIAELKAALGTLEAYSDDWYSVSDALNEAQENLADIKNKINEINKMKLDIVLQMHENEDKPLPYQQSMYQSQADYYAATNKPGESFVFRKAAIDKNAEIIWQNNVEKGDLERLMKEQFEEGTDAWLETRDAIWKINEENAQLTAQNAQETKQLYLDMIQQVQSDTQKWSAPNEFAINYLDVTKSKAQRNENYLLNRNAMRAQNFMYTDRINQNTAAMARLQALLDDLWANGKYGTEEWLAAYEALNQLRTETEQYTDTIEENNKAIEQSRMDEVLQYYQDLEAALKNITEYQSTYTSLAKSIRNYDEYQSSMKKELELNTQQTQRDDEEIARLKKLLEETTDPGVRRSLWQQIAQLEQTRNSRVASDYNKDVELQKSYIDEINTPYNNRQAVANRDLSIQETVTKIMETNGDYEGAQASREKELEMIYQQRDAKLAHIKELKELMDSRQITNAEQAEQLANTIYKEEQEAANLYLKAAQKQKEVNDHAAEIANMIKELNFNEAIGAHKLNMLQMDVAGYTKAGDLSTANDMLDKVNDQIRKNIEARQASIDAIKQQLEAEDLSKEKQMELYNTLMQKTEALKRDEWALRDNTAAQIENYRAMLTARAQMEAFIRKNNQKLQSDAESRVDAMANVAKSIYAVLKKEKEDEWALLSKDIEKQKQAIEEEKNLLETRLNLRKAARDKENKQRELAEYRAQLERIAADPTRTKDAKELQAKIKELQESLEDTEAEERMQSAQERMDDQIAALGDFQEYYGEQLTKFLENAQNFQTEISTIISSGMNGWISWMKEHSQEYNNMSLEMQKQAIQNWQKMWEGSHTFHDYVGDTSKIFASLESWLEYVKGSEEYKQSTATEKLLLLMTQSQNYAKAYSMEPEKIYTSLDKWLNMTIKSSELYQKASAEQQAKMEEIWTKMWDSWIRIFDGNNIPTSEDLDIALREGSKTTEELLNEILGLETKDYSAMIAELGNQTKALENLTKPTDYTSESKAPTENEEMSPEISEFIKGIRTEMQNLGGAIADANRVLPETLGQFSKTLKDDLYEGVGKPVEDVTKDNTAATQDQTAATHSNANETRTAGGHANTASKKVEENTKAVKDNTDAWRELLTDVRSSNGDKAPVVTKSETDSGGYNNDVRREAFAAGGYVKYTGPAWVDGTPTRPESFLDAVDTKLLREQLDTYSKIKTMPMTLPSDRSFTSNSNNTVGDINIVINQADLSSDDDINEVAAKVGKIFVKEISKSGLRLDRLSF